MSEEEQEEEQVEEEEPVELPPPEEDKFKIIFLGDSNVGKTSIITMYMYGKCDSKHQATVGIDFITRSVTSKDGSKMKLQIWDTAGQERFRSLIPNYVRDSDAAVVVFDVGERESFEGSLDWLDEVIKDEKTRPHIVFLVGNKIDLKKRAVEESEGDEMAKERGVQYIEVSAKDNSNIKTLFEEIIGGLPQEIKKKQYPTTVRLAVSQQSKKRCC